MINAVWPEPRAGDCP